MKLLWIVWLLLAAWPGCAQTMEVFGGAEQNRVCGGVSVQVRRVRFTVEHWQEGAVPGARLGTVALRVWRGVHWEVGGGARRTVDTVRRQYLTTVPILDPWCSRKCAPLGYGDRIETETWEVVNWRRVATTGASYQTSGRVFVRAGYRWLFVVGDRDESQVYAALGWRF